jgi:hypothetical protein
MAESIKRDYYAEAKAMLQEQAAALPADADAKERAMYTHPAVIEQIAARMQFPEAFEGLPPMSFRMTIKDFEEQQHREEEKQRREEERPRLQTENPPASESENSKMLKYFAYLLAVLCVIAAVVALVVVGIVVVGNQSPAWAIVPLAASVGFGFWSYSTFVKSHTASLKWETQYHTIVYNPALKGGRPATVEVQLELPVGWSTPETLSRLESCAKAPLYELFANSDTVPLRSKVWDCIERQLAVKQNELNLGICRMELLKNVDPAMPAFGSRHVFSSNGIIVTYEIADLWRTDAVNAKLAEMLAANPGTDLTRHAKTLNIRFIDIEKQVERKVHKGFAFNG